MENAKVYVDVLVNFDKDGTMSPVDFIWEDGEKYHVDRILARERCASRKAGGTGLLVPYNRQLLPYSDP